MHHSGANMIQTVVKLENLTVTDNLHNTWLRERASYN